MSENVGLKKLPVPEDQDPSSFIFASEDALSNPDKLMILIHGSGVVRAGQWARRYLHFTPEFDSHLLIVC